MKKSAQRLLGLMAVLAVCASAQNAGISGTVQDSSGRPQMGAVVEIFTSNSASPLKALTDIKGHFTFAGILPGTYFVKATADSFLPSLRENVSVKAGARVLVNMTLNTLVEAFQLLPSRRNTEQESDDWKWTLRSAANRPILRVLEEGGPLVVVSKSEDASDRTLKARVAFLAGTDSNGFSGNDVTTQFNVEQSLFGAGKMTFLGNLGGDANGAMRVSYRHQMPNGSHPEISVTARRFAQPDTAMQHAALSALALAMSDGMTLGNFLELNYGGELQTVQFRGRVTHFAPFGSASMHLGPNTVLEYRRTSSVPNLRLAKGFDTAPADLSETSPRVTLAGGDPLIERAAHQELALSRRFGKNNFQAALFSDKVRNYALQGVGDVGLGPNDVNFASGDFMPDVYAGTFGFNGGTLETKGVRAVASRQLNDRITATLGYSWGGVLTANGDRLAFAGAGSPGLFRTERAHAVTGKLMGSVPGAKTRWMASYKWTSGAHVLTPVDLFNKGPGQADPYLNIFIRQPLPGMSFLPGKMEALIDVRNLLAQGYVPMFGADGRTLYLVQTPRSIRTGVSFNF